MAQVIENLPSKREALNPTPTSTKKAELSLLT
jgi:hypothetical protein